MRGGSLVITLSPLRVLISLIHLVEISHEIFSFRKRSVFSTVTNAQTWVYAPSVTTATYDPVSATTTYRQCLCNCYETGRCVCHPCWIRTWKTYNIPEKQEEAL